MNVISSIRSFNRIRKHIKPIVNNKIIKHFTIKLSNKISSSNNYNYKLFSTFNENDGELEEETNDLSSMKPLPFSYDCLPEETMFVIDGTSWLFNAYYRLL